MISKIALGDSHNFHRRVSLIQEANRALIQKPRSIYWEYLFLDPQSPLRGFLRNLDTHVNFDSILGSIKINTSDNFKTGTSELVLETPIVDQNLWLKAFGEILAVTSVFGITDLHRENVLNVNNRPQLVDIECLFWDLELPSETFLLPKGDFEWSKSIWTSTEFSGLKTLPSESLKLILEGYNLVLEYFKLHHEALANFFRTLGVEKFPVRLLIERTRDYRAKLDAQGNLESAFLKEEVVQLKRGDIPYFFGFSGEKEIRFFDTETSTAEMITRSEKLSMKLARSFQTPDTLLLPSRLLRLQKQGILEIVVRLFDPKNVPFESPELRIFNADGFQKIVFKDMAVQVRMSNNG